MAEDMEDKVEAVFDFQVHNFVTYTPSCQANPVVIQTALLVYKYPTLL
jgi:hypothetical protein